MVTEYHVKIRGVAPLLMHAPSGMGQGSSKKGVIPSPEDEAKQALYLDAKGKIVVPARCVEGALVKAAAGLRAPGQGRKTLKNYILAGLIVDPLDIPLDSQEYIIDRRRAVIQRQGILRARPRFDEWGLAFKLQVVDEYLQSPGMDKTIRELVSEAGALVGLLDFRPRFGRFRIEKFEKVENGK
jgi:hypothetical protein